MTGTWTVLFFLSVILHFHCAFNAQVTKVSCFVGTDCVLPCNFDEADSDIIVHWKKINDWSGEVYGTVHSYNNNQDQPQLQLKDYEGRTSLKEILTGEASLLLTDIRYQDHGRYVCTTTSKSNSSITTVDLQVTTTIVPCAVGTDCVLPCNFMTGPDVSIHWTKSPGDRTIHSYHSNQDQFQHEDYRGRTFLKEVHRGEASLLLRHVRKQDEGRYECNTSSSSDTRVIPVYLSVHVTEVSCALGTDCILPCNFTNGSDVSIHWKTTGNGTVHSYYNNQQQLQLQHEDYRGRTSLEDIHRGEASLLLREVKLQDEGSYMCNTSTSSGKNVIPVNLKVFVSCAVGTDCVLPCDFETGSDISINWTKISDWNNVPYATVHSYHSHQDQLQLQHEDYRGRTFLKEVHRGEASLLLRDVRITDKGRYMCNTTTKRNSSITTMDLKVFVSEVSCAVGTQCVLPCTFKTDSDVSIHWRKISGAGTVHSYYRNQEQLQLQHEDYRGRTFLKEVHRGEASLLLRDVRITDEGRYMCNTSSGSKSHINTVDFKVFVSSVSCGVGTDCVLPCEGLVDADVSIHWRKTAGDAAVHSYHSYQDQLQLQHEDFSGRTFLKEVKRGEASLLLRDVRITDEGRYMCVTSSSRGSGAIPVDLKVFVSDFKEDVVMQDSELIFSFEGLFPKPEVRCHPKVNTTFQQREDLLYNAYITVPYQSLKSTACSVSSAHRWRMVSFLRQLPVESYYQEAFFQCFASSKTNIIWKFNNEVIFSMTSSEHFLNESWRPFMDALTRSLDLVLKDLTPEQEGFYFCFNRRQFASRLKDEIDDDTLSVTAFQLKINMRQKLQKLSEGYLDLTIATLGLMMCCSFIAGYAVHYFKKTVTRQKLKSVLSSLSLSTLVEKMKSLSPYNLGVRAQQT